MDQKENFRKSTKNVRAPVQEVEFNIINNVVKFVSFKRIITYKYVIVKGP